MKQKINALSASPVLHYLLLVVCIYFVVFLKIGSFPFRFWDESMFAVNAYEMEKNGNYMVPYYDHAVDWRNSKPLLLTWIQAGFIKIFGFNEFSMRLPTALAVSGSILFLFHFLRKRGDLLIAWIGSLILLTSQGYLTYHTGRTADADALLSFFLLASSLNFCQWACDFHPKNLLFCLFFLALGILTKSFAALLFVPGMLFFALLHNRSEMLRAFRSISFYLGLASLLVAVYIAFFLRDSYQPGFLTYTLSHDAGRVGVVIENHQHGWDFYLDALLKSRFTWWVIPFLAGIPLVFQIPQGPKRTIGQAILAIAFCYLILISVSTTKLIWYDMPLYPLLSLIAAIPLYLLVEKFTHPEKKMGRILLLILIFFLPYRTLFFASQNNAFAAGDHQAELTSIYLHHQLKSGLAAPITIYHHGYDGSLLCYKYMYADLGIPLRITRTLDFKSGETVFIGHDALKEHFLNNVSADTISTFYEGLTMRVR